MWKILFVVWIVPAPFSASDYGQAPAYVSASHHEFKTYAECDKARREIAVNYDKLLNRELAEAFRAGKAAEKHDGVAVTQCVTKDKLVTGSPA